MSINAEKLYFNNRLYIYELIKNSEENQYIKKNISVNIKTYFSCKCEITRIRETLIVINIQL